MLTSNVQLGYVLTGGGGQAVQGGLSCPPPRISDRMDNQQFLLHHLLQKYLVITDINFISVNLRCSLQRFSWVTYWQGVGGKLSREVYLAPPPRISERIDNPQNFITPSATGIFSWKEYKHYFNQTEMLTSTVQLGYVLTGGGGQAVQGGLSCPPPRISKRMDNPSAILITSSASEIFSWERYKLYFSQSEMLTSNVSWVTYWQGVGGKLSRAVYLAPHLEFQRELIIPKFYYTICYRNICWKRYKHYFSQSEMLTSNVQLGYVLTRGGGQAVQGGLSCPPPRISERMDNWQILLHHLLQEYLVQRDINIISVNLRCSLETFSWVTYWQGVGGKLSRAVYLAPRPEFQRERIIRNYYYIIYFRNI